MSLINYKKINSCKVHPVKLERVKSDQIKGYDLIENLYANIYICAKKFSGKTNLLFEIMKNCADKRTKIIIICSTVHLDDTYSHIIDYFEGRGNPVITFTSIKDGNVDNLDEIMNTIEEDKRTKPQDDADEDPDPEPVSNYPFKFMGDSPESVKRTRKKRKPAKVAQETIIVLDDLSAECRRKSVASLMKKNRHFKCKVIISSQHPNDLQPESLKQLQVAILFGGHSDDKLIKFHRDLDLTIDRDTFIDMYREVTLKPFNFLYVDVGRGRYRKNLDTEIIV